jgi:hypothetical protein
VLKGQEDHKVQQDHKVLKVHKVLIQEDKEMLVIQELKVL